MPGEWGTPTTQTAILQAVAARIRSQVTRLDGENLCFLSMHPQPAHEMRQPLYATVAPMSGRYDDEIFDGSGDTLEKSGVVITVWNDVKLDRQGGDERSLTDESRGLLTLKRLILKALSEHTLLDANSNKILKEPMRPINSGHPNRNDEEHGSFSVSFSTDFVWDLSAES